MDRRVTQLTRVTSPTWGPPPTCKQALNSIVCVYHGKMYFLMNSVR